MQTIIYGYHAVEAALKAHPERILTVYFIEKEKSKRLDALRANLKQQAITSESVKPATMERLCGNEHHQGIAAKIHQIELNEKDLFNWIAQSQKVPLLLLLEEIQDPHNLGAVFRSALAFGVDWVVISKNNTAPLNALVSKVACGADQLMNKIIVANMARFIQEIQKRDFWVVGLDVEAKTDLSQASLKRPLAIIMGQEGKGLKRLTLESCDELAKIAMSGDIESLNVSVATGICLYEVQRQRATAK